VLEALKPKMSRMEMEASWAGRAAADREEEEREMEELTLSTMTSNMDE